MNSVEVQICTLRVQGAEPQTPALGLRLAHQLNTADLHLAGLPPAAVLVVRQLRDPLPGRIVSTRPVVRVDTAWEMAVRQSLEKSYRQAARPHRGLILGEPDAVVFADEAEMLACLLLAQQLSLPPTAWWFRTLVNRMGSARTLVGQLMERPDLIPAVFGYLVAWNKVEDALVKISSQQSFTLLQAIIKQFQLPALLLLERAVFRIASSPERSQIPKGPQSRQRKYRHLSNVQPPWERFLSGAVPTNLAPEQQALLGLCLLLQIRPAELRNLTFQREWQQWWQSVRDYSLEPTAQPAIHSSTIAIPSQIDKNRDPISPQVEKISSESAAPHKPEKILLTQHHMEEAEDGVNAIRPLNSDIALSPNTSSSNEDPAIFYPSKPWISEAKTLHPSSQIDIVMQQPDNFASPGSGVETALGGVLYLISLMQMLDLPASCESGWGLASQVSAWGVLELLGRALLGPAGIGYASDSLWRVLSDLDGRQGETLPGEDYLMVGDGSLPTGWAAVVDDSWSPGDCPLLHGINADLKHWLKLVVPLVARRLRHVLGLQVAEDMPSILLMAPGHLYVTRSHVDLVMDLNAISLPVRRAGMDANPGWLPAFGRVVIFHFL